MSIGPEDVSSAMQSGAPITCATCTHFHTGEGVCGKGSCGGPPSGRDFPDYAGEIPRGRFVDRCLICGGKSTCVLITPGADTLFGLCRPHRGVFDKIPSPPGVVVAPPIVLELPNETPRP